MMRPGSIIKHSMKQRVAVTAGVQKKMKVGMCNKKFANLCGERKKEMFDMINNCQMGNRKAKLMIRKWANMMEFYEDDGDLGKAILNFELKNGKSERICELVDFKIDLEKDMRGYNTFMEK